MKTPQAVNQALVNVAKQGQSVIGAQMCVVYVGHPSQTRVAVGMWAILREFCERKETQLDQTGILNSKKRTELCHKARV